MRVVEYQHRSEGGGNMVHLSNETWRHGELVLIVSKRELKVVLNRAKHLLKEKLVTCHDLEELLSDIDKL